MFDKDKTESLLEKLVSQLVEKSSSAGLTMDQLESILDRVGKNSADAMRHSLKPENPDHPAISAFSYPEGDIKRPKPDLRVKTWFCGIEENKDRLTPAEVEAYNAIKNDRTARNGDWKAEIKHKGQTKEELHIWIPCETVDQRMGLPPLVLILNELNGGPSTEDIAGLLSKITTLESELATARSQRGLVAELEAAL
jgi:hypothetical protein